eukprot:TRINITY_DN12463_c0_g1_i1.p1 TRINITY_DN12463_c0_g1~~TRINITY_DN12463_c0_g1_i1.p1  ORF type:complete len:385 (-),score=59.55 TRINITY_DN12463_c0_g1_i1:79-1233(-)
MHDTQGISRGRCNTAECPCSEYKHNAKSTTDRCDYCDCVPIRHVVVDVQTRAISTAPVTDDFALSLNGSPEIGASPQVTPCSMQLLDLSADASSDDDAMETTPAGTTTPAKTAKKPRKPSPLTPAKARAQAVRLATIGDVHWIKEKAKDLIWWPALLEAKNKAVHAYKYFGYGMDLTYTRANKDEYLVWAERPDAQMLQTPYRSELFRAAMREVDEYIMTRKRPSCFNARVTIHPHQDALDIYPTVICKECSGDNLYQAMNMCHHPGCDQGRHPNCHSEAVYHCAAHPYEDANVLKAFQRTKALLEQDDEQQHVRPPRLVASKCASKQMLLQALDAWKQKDSEAAGAVDVFRECFEREYEALVNKRASPASKQSPGKRLKIEVE